MAWQIRDATDDAEMFSVPTKEPKSSAAIKDLASMMLANLLSNPPLTKDKDLFLDAMQEATATIIGAASALPPNPFMRPGPSRSISSPSSSHPYGLPPRIDPGAKVSTHHSLASSAAPLHPPPTFSATAPPHLKIPLHHLSPLNATASGPKEKTETLSEFARLRAEKVAAVQAAKERDARWGTVDLLAGGGGGGGGTAGPNAPGLTLSSAGAVVEAGLSDDADLGVASSRACGSGRQPSAASIESLLGPQQLSSLTQIYTAMAPEGAEGVSSKTLLVGLHQSRALRRHFGDVVVDGVCAGLRALKGSTVTWTELLCLVVNPKGGEGFDVGESVDLSGLRLSGMS